MYGDAEDNYQGSWGWIKKKEDSKDPGEVGVWNRSIQYMSRGWKKQKEDSMALDKLAPGAKVDETKRPWVRKEGERRQYGPGEVGD